MPIFRRAAATAAAMTLASMNAAFSLEGNGALSFVNQQQMASLDTSGPAAGAKPATSPHRPGVRSEVEKQVPSVSTGCLKPQLMEFIRAASTHFGSTAVITSGYRTGRRSYHGRCMAADVQIEGVGAGALARYFRGLPGVGGVGTYNHTRSVHVDIAPRRFTWHHGRRKRTASA